MYQDEAGFGRISKLGSCWAPIGGRPHVHNHYSQLKQEQDKRAS